MGVRRIDDSQHPRGYREIRSNAEMRKLMDSKIAAQKSVCALCKGQFSSVKRNLIYSEKDYPPGLDHRMADSFTGQP